MTGYVGDVECVVVVVVVSTVVVRLVGRTGGSGVPLDCDVVETAGQLELPHCRSVGQHPPPRLAGHDWNPDEQVAGRVAECVTVTVRVIVEISGATLVAEVGDVVVDVVVVVVERDETDGVIVV